MSYAHVNGVELYYEQHGDGEPLVLLHGGIGAGELWAPILPALAAQRTVITVDLVGHGRTADPGRPLRPEHLADDVAALVAQLDPGSTDVMGYSLGGLTALRLAIQHPDAVRRLVLVSVAARRSGSHPEVLAAMDQMRPELADALKQSPNYALYERIAPRPEDWGLLIARTSEVLKVDYDWTAEIARITAQTLLVYADQDSITPAHIVEFYGLLGGGLRDAGWDGAQRAPAQLAVLPGTTHYDIYTSPALAPAVLPFLLAG
jgi:pimeloyl-ACP methyl ester carboxylesterase